jgi:hypothetical protein
LINARVIRIEKPKEVSSYDKKIRLQKLKEANKNRQKLIGQLGGNPLKFL